jgi:hypothetical protein
VIRWRSLSGRDSIEKRSTAFIERGTSDRLSSSLDRIDRVGFGMCNMAEIVALLGVEPWALPTQPFRCDKSYCFTTVSRSMIECGFESFSIMECPSLIEIISSFSIEEGHSTTSLDRSDNEFPPLQACCFCHIERAGSAHPTELPTLPLYWDSDVPESIALSTIPSLNHSCRPSL